MQAFSMVLLLIVTVMFTLLFGVSTVYETVALSR